MSEPEFLSDAPVRALVKTLLILGALWVTLGLFHNSGPLIFTHQARGASRDHLMTLPAQRLGETNLVFHRSHTEAEKRILTEQLRLRDQLVEYRATWPEYAGYALMCLFVGAVLGLGYRVVTGPHKRVRDDLNIPQRLHLLAALSLSYWLATVLGWVWLSALPFLATGFLFALLSELIRRDLLVT